MSHDDQGARAPIDRIAVGVAVIAIVAAVLAMWIAPLSSSFWLDETGTIWGIRGTLGESLATDRGFDQLPQGSAQRRQHHQDEQHGHNGEAARAAGEAAGHNGRLSTCTAWYSDTDSPLRVRVIWRLASA